MKKMIVTAVVAAMTAGGFAASAKTTDKKSARQDICPATEQQCHGQRGPGQAAPCPFDGLNLTDRQKSQLRQLNDTRRAEGAKKLEAKLAAKAQKKEARIQARRDQLAQIKSILTPEQYVKFLENSFVHRSAKQIQKQGKANKHDHKPRHHKGKPCRLPQAANN